MSKEFKDELQLQNEEVATEKEEKATPEEEATKIEENSETEPVKEENVEADQPQEKEELKSDESDTEKEDKEDQPKEEDLEADESNTKPAEQEQPETVEENVKPEEIDSEREDLIAQLEDLRAEKEEREALENCNKEVMKVEQEFTACTDRIAQALKDSFTQNGIDPSKTLAELEKEEPAKATLAKQFIEQAQQLRAQLEEAAIKEITKHQNNVIYLAASREFEKMGLNLEQAKEAVQTFKRIANEVGIVDLGEDLKMKVQLAAGRAKLLHPTIEQVSEPKVVDTTTLEEPNPEKETAEVIEEVKEEKEVPPAPIVEKPKASDFEEGVIGQTSANAGTLINELNVLEELAKLPYKERTKFYKEHEDVIAKALSQRG